MFNPGLSWSVVVCGACVTSVSGSFVSLLSDSQVTHISGTVGVDSVFEFFSSFIMIVIPLSSSSYSSSSSLLFVASS